MVPPCSDLSGYPGSAATNQQATVDVSIPPCFDLQHGAVRRITTLDNFGSFDVPGAALFDSHRRVCQVTTSASRAQDPAGLQDARELEFSTV